MKIIFAQGNPGTQYAGTRHNIGFLMLDEFAKKHGATFSPKPKFHAEIAELALENEKILLVKPTTFYNDTGIAARALIDFYKLNPAVDFLAVHDELALPFGVIKVRANGSDAGNNGVKSLNNHIGNEYYRLRIGIYNSLRDQVNDAKFVLATFSQEENGQIPAIYTYFAVFGEKFISGQLSSTKIIAF
jgi:peptidyl-tRNA hydrolase, PTH1 family